MALPPQQFCVRWNSYHTNLQTVFPHLLQTEQFADVTLACESRQLRCHKLVLSACSAYLERLLLQNPCKHPIVFMKDMRFSEMKALVDFMYKGEVNVTQDELPSLLKSAEALQIRGLCSGDAGGLSSELGAAKEHKDFTVATEALLAQAQRDAPVNGTSPPSDKSSPPAPRKRAAPAAHTHAPAHTQGDRHTHTHVKEEQVEEDGLFYGELDNDNMDYTEDDDSGKPGSSLGQSSGRADYIRVKPESELVFHNKLKSLASNSEYMAKLAQMNAKEIQHEFTKYGLDTHTEEYAKRLQNSENDYYKSWLEQNGELEVSLLKASEKNRKPKTDPKNAKSEVELIPKPKSLLEKSLSDIRNLKPSDVPIRRRGRPPIFKDRNVDIGESVLKSDLDQFLEGKEVSSSGLSRRDLERVMMGKFNPNRRYSNEAMWAALMDVKKGGSIYRAAQTHKVPRKSLRNWMKRCHIKSSFPMPQQLKQFVENSKKQKEYEKSDTYQPEADTYQPEADAYQPEATAEQKHGSDQEYPVFDNETEFGKHFLSFQNPVSSDDERVSGRTDYERVNDGVMTVGDDKCEDAALNMSIRE